MPAVEPINECVGTIAPGACGADEGAGAALGAAAAPENDDAPARGPTEGWASTECPPESLRHLDCGIADPSLQLEPKGLRRDHDSRRSGATPFFIDDATHGGDSPPRGKPNDYNGGLKHRTGHTLETSSGLHGTGIRQEDYPGGADRTPPHEGKPPTTAKPRGPETSGIECGE